MKTTEKGDIQLSYFYLYHHGQPHDTRDHRYHLKAINHLRLPV
jgi:hypothetical protein